MDRRKELKALLDEYYNALDAIMDKPDYSELHSIELIDLVHNNSFAIYKLRVQGKTLDEATTIVMNQVSNAGPKNGETIH